MIVGSRQGRPNLPSTGYPFCPGGTEAPFTQISDDAPPSQDVCVTPEQAEYNASHYSSIK